VNKVEINLLFKSEFVCKSIDFGNNFLPIVQLREQPHKNEIVTGIGINLERMQNNTA
jgi:hypothetical protein